MNKFKERLNELLQESDKNQTYIAKQINISRQTLTNYKSGYSEPNIDLLIKIADYFNVCIDYLVGRQDWF